MIDELVEQYLTEARVPKEKDWVKITKGVYKGEVGYISNVNGSSKRVTIELTVKGKFIQDSEPFDNIKVVPKPKFED